jgi:hypothetical protein
VTWAGGNTLTLWRALADDGQVIVRCDQVPGWSYGPLPGEEVHLATPAIRSSLLKYRSLHTRVDWPGGEPCE